MKESQEIRDYSDKLYFTQMHGVSFWKNKFEAYGFRIFRFSF